MAFYGVPSLARPKGIKELGPRPKQRRRLSDEHIVAIRDRLKPGSTPLDVIIEIMTHYVSVEDYDKALTAASAAAPYVHAKLAHVTGDTKNETTHRFVLVGAPTASTALVWESTMKKLCTPMPPADA
jgi:hypothetical protein